MTGYEIYLLVAVGPCYFAMIAMLIHIFGFRKGGGE